jgi:hypothetical protein
MTFFKVKLLPEHHLTGFVIGKNEMVLPAFVNS